MHCFKLLLLVTEYLILMFSDCVNFYFMTEFQLIIVYVFII